MTPFGAVFCGDEYVQNPQVALQVFNVAMCSWINPPPVRSGGGPEAPP
jgi:hypothetical protein